MAVFENGTAVFLSKKAEGVKIALSFRLTAVWGGYRHDEQLSLTQAAFAAKIRHRDSYCYFHFVNCVKHYASLALLGLKPICHVQVGLFSSLSPHMEGGDSVGLSMKPLMAAVTCNKTPAIHITHAVLGVSPRAACQGGRLNETTEWLHFQKSYFCSSPFSCPWIWII